MLDAYGSNGSCMKAAFIITQYARERERLLFFSFVQSSGLKKTITVIYKGEEEAITLLQAIGFIRNKQLLNVLV